ncbi:MAG: GAF domain-containing protein [Chloroflexi bacterium]|nr:GAF domain-containing protein [Chloroflexota bacterium]
MSLRFISGSLSRRIIASVAIGLSLILVLFGFVALWRINESTEGAYRGRVALAQALVSRLDDVLRYYLATLEREAADLGGSPRYPLADLSLRLGSFATVTATDAQGNTLWTDPPALPTESEVRHHSSVGLVLLTGLPQVAEFVEPGASGKVYACLAAPVRDRNGQVTGALMAQLDPGHPALNLLPSSTMGSGFASQLINREGQLLGGSQGSRTVMEHPALLADLISAGQAGYRTHEQSSSSEDGGHVVAYAPSRLLPSWGITVEQSSDTLLATSRHILERQILFGIAAMLLAVAVTWFGVRRVVRPLKLLTSVAERFAVGNLEEPINLNRDDEIGILARAFESMRVRLRASLAEVAEWNRQLERRVAARTRELEQRNLELAHLNAIATAVSGSLDVKDMLERTIDHLLQMTGAEGGYLWMMQGEEAPLKLVAQKGSPATQGREHMCPKDCLCLRALSSDSIGALDADKEGFRREIECLGITPASMLTVPVPSGKGVQAVLLLVSSSPGQIRQVKLSTLTAVGRQVGIALDNARLYESLRAREHERAELLQRVMVAQEEERRRLAQELHDETSQALASLQLGLERLATGSEGLDQDRSLAIELQGIAARTLVDVHRLAVELRPSVLDDVGLVPAIGRYLQECGQRAGLAVDLASVGVDHFPRIPAVETAIYRIVQEALTNVIQHAQAKRVSVLLERRGEKLIVVIEDDGRGFTLEEKRAEPLEARLGLAGMEERASLIGATLTIETAPGAGTTVFLEIPIDQSGAREGT